MQQRIFVPLEQKEMRALLDLAAKECRHPREQARFFVLQGLQSKGLIPSESQTGPEEREVSDEGK